MKHLRSIPGAIAVAALVLTSAPQAHAILTVTAQQCRQAVAKATGKFVATKMKAKQSCNDKELKAPGSCDQAKTTTKINAAEQKMRDSIAGKCSVFSGAGFTNFLGYPGKCTDPDPSNAFTLLDLQNCMFDSHEAAVDKVLAIQYNTNATLDAATLNCQKALSKNAGKYLNAKLKAIQKCRNSVESGKLAIQGTACASETKAAAAITKAESKARAGIQAKCINATQIQTIGICNDPSCTSFCGTCNELCAENCIIATHGKEVDDSAIDFSDLIDFEYATAPVCGDQAVDQPDEECDGSDDGNCPDACGIPSGPFPCLCTDTPRERVIEHKESDLDNGWKGDSHDAGTVEGGGYVVDLYDCDGPAGPDSLCTVGPSCTGGAHINCAKDSDCGADAPCRKSRVATGPFCNLDPTKRCPNGLPDCPGFGNYCVQKFHGPPLPLAAGSIQVCVLNIFTEDVYGTKDVAVGAAAVRIRQKSITHLTGTSPPCPVCGGGWCTTPPPNQGGDITLRHLCNTTAECADVSPTSVCNFGNTCNSGLNYDKPCRPAPPFGGATSVFGNPSVDCPPDPTADVSQGGLDILFNPATTETVSLAPSVSCSEPVFAGKTCAGGTNNGATCTTNSECPGGTCSFQCFCPNVGGATRQQPNSCGAACVGGTNDAFGPCSDNSECPGGFCHLADCRIDPTAVAALQPNEGGCTITSEGHCSTTTYRTCSQSLDCTPGGGCARCLSDNSEFCITGPKNCFINSGIVREGVADTTNPISAAIFCIRGTGTGSVDATAGLPGPGALRQPTTVIDTGF